MKIRVVDFETTGFDVSAGICEVGFTDVTLSDGEPKVGETIAQLINPEISIPFEAMAVHHITDRDVDAAPTCGRAWSLLKWGLNDEDYYCAHNAQFEQQFYEGDNAWICTYKCAMRLLPDAAQHNNQYLRYYLGLNLPARRANPPHRAGPDSFVTAHILCALLKDHEFDELLKISGEPVVLRKMLFGKHKGKFFEDIPHDYLEWILQADDMPEDVAHTAKVYLGKA